MASDELLDEQVEDLFPIDGPHNADKTRAAGRSIAALVRYLNHATYHAAATPYPSTIDGVLHSLSAAVSGLDQLLRHLDAQLGVHVARSGAYSDDGRNAAEVGATARAYLHNAAAYLANGQDALAQAASLTSHLGVHD